MCLTSKDTVSQETGNKYFLFGLSSFFIYCWMWMALVSFKCQVVLFPQKK